MGDCFITVIIVAAKVCAVQTSQAHGQVVALVALITNLPLDATLFQVMLYFISKPQEE